MLTGLHVLLTYRCTHECEHCFVRGSPRADGTFRPSEIDTVLAEADRIGSVEWIYFEGGEPFLYYPLLVDGLRRAKEHGYRTGVVTNGYWADSPEVAKLLLEPLAEAGVEDLNVSDDALHWGDSGESPAKRAAEAAEALGIPVSRICIDPAPKATAVVHRGRAADLLTEGLPLFPPTEFDSCSKENLAEPTRVHLDAFGNVHVCQGISMGNMWITPLSELVRDWDASRHPICGPILAGGPARLAADYLPGLGGRWVSSCHLCYSARRRLVDRFPHQLGPRQLYEEERD